MFHLPQKTSTYSNYLQRPRAVQRHVAKPAPAEMLTSTRVAERCGVSLRQIQWWDEQGVVSPRQDGHSRIYTEAEARLVGLVAALRRKGLSLHQIRKGMPALRRAQPGEFVVQDRRAWRICSTVEAVSKMALEATGPVVVVRVP